MLWAHLFASFCRAGGLPLKYLVERFGVNSPVAAWWGWGLLSILKYAFRQRFSCRSTRRV